MTQSNNKFSTEVLILGGGIAGLSVANVLEQQKISYKIIEKRSDYKNEGAGLILWNNALLALQDIIGQSYLNDLKQSISEICIHSKNDTYLTKVPVSDFQTFINENKIPGAIAVERSRLIDWLAKSIPNENIILNDEASEIIVEKKQNDIQVVTKSGQQVHSKYLICADGVRSASRVLLKDPPKLFDAKHSIYRGLVQNTFTGLQNNSKTFLNNGCYFMYHRTVSGKIYWALSYSTINGQKELKSLVEKFPGISSDLVQATRSEDIVHSSVHRHTKTDFCQHFSNILYVGDAAHATSPQMGQGAAMAIEDAAYFLKDFKQNCGEVNYSIKDSFQRLKNNRLHRTNFVINRSHQLSKIYHLSNALVCNFRDSILKYRSPKKMKAVLSKIVTGYQTSNS